MDAHPSTSLVRVSAKLIQMNFQQHETILENIRIYAHTSIFRTSESSCLKTSCPLSSLRKEVGFVPISECTSTHKHAPTLRQVSACEWYGKGSPVGFGCAQIAGTVITFHKPSQRKLREAEDATREDIKRCVVLKQRTNERSQCYI